MDENPNFKEWIAFLRKCFWSVLLMFISEYNQYALVNSNTSIK